jgi:hypothetical protein
MSISGRIESALDDRRQALGLDLKILFLVLLIISAFIFGLRRGPVLRLGDVWVIFLDFLLVPLVLSTVLIFALIITDTDPMNLILRVSQVISGRFNVSFLEAIPPRLENALSVKSVTRQDTDGDGFNEWVVFYQFDVQSGKSPILGAIYDNDRGNPPVIFPYQLRAPDRDYLSEGEAPSLNFSQIDSQGPEEVLTRSSNEITIFKFKEANKSPEWQPPKDNPAVYETIGFFRGSGGVSFDEATKQVTVISRDAFERSQLVWRAIYAFDTKLGSYFQPTQTATPQESPVPASPILLPPIMETVDFFQSPPNDIFQTSFPEKIVLAFYAATCGGQDETLCRNAGVEWQAIDFLAPVESCNQANARDTAYCEFQSGNAGYFGLNSLRNERNIRVRTLRYYPGVEEVTSLAVNQDPLAYAGAVPRANCVEISLGNPRRGLPDTYFYQMKLHNGQWKIDKRSASFEQCAGASRLSLDDAATFAPPSDQALPPLGPPDVEATRVPLFQP